MRSAILVATLALLSACATGVSYWSRPDLSKLSIGMTQDDVVSILGKPAKVAAQGNVIYLQYAWVDPWDSHADVDEEYFVRLVNGRVDAFGEKGDFDSTRPPGVEVRQDITIRHADEH